MLNLSYVQKYVSHSSTVPVCLCGITGLNVSWIMWSDTCYGPVSHLVAESAVMRMNGKYWIMVSLAFVRESCSRGERVGWLQQIHIVSTDLILSSCRYSWDRILSSHMDNRVDCILWLCFRKTILTKHQSMMMGFYWKLWVLQLEENWQVSEEN